jgi:large subunit ribosomal protein L14
MLGLLSKIKIVDNTGIIQGRCIKILKPNKKDGAIVGDVILISVLKSLSNSKFSPGSLAKALIIRSKFSSFSDNAGIIINDKSLPVGSRIRGPVSFKLNKNIKLITIASANTII